MEVKCSLAVLFGGKSSEYEVSLVSASSVIRHADPDKYDLMKIGITRDGRWFLFEGPVEDIETGRWCAETAAMDRVMVNPSAGSRELLFVSPAGRVTTRRVDVVFPVLHGAFGEDGTLQGMLSLAGIPVVGCGCLSSALCMDKSMAKAVLNDAGVLQARAVLARRADYEKDPEGFRQRAEEAFGYPMFVKPSNAGSSVGVSKVKAAEDFAPAMEKAFREDWKVLVEECVVGREIEVAVLEEKGRYTVSVPAEIDPGAEFYDYDTKYVDDTAKFYIPARLPAETAERVRRLAEKVFRTLDCRGLARVDFFVREDGTVLLNEVNTLPGFTSISMYPKLMTYEGMTYGELVDRLIRAAL